MSCELLAIENLSQALRAGRISPSAVEGVCKHANLFSQIGEACRRGALTSLELDEFVLHYLNDARSSHAHGFRPHSWKSFGDVGSGCFSRFVHPRQFERFLRGRIRFTEEQLEQLTKMMPYSDALLQSESWATDALLFPGHPDISMKLLLKVFHSGIGASVYFQAFPEDMEYEVLPRSAELNTHLELGWYLMRRKPEPMVEAASFSEQFRRVDATTCRLPRMVELTTMVLLSEFLMLGDKPYDDAVPLRGMSAWCAEPGGEKSSKPFAVGPYEYTKNGIPLGLRLSRFSSKEGRTSSVQLFLVRKPDK